MCLPSIAPVVSKTFDYIYGDVINVYRTYQYSEENSISAKFLTDALPFGYRWWCMHMVTKHIPEHMASLQKNTTDSESAHPGTKR